MSPKFVRRFEPQGRRFTNVHYYYSLIIIIIIIIVVVVVVKSKILSGTEIFARDDGKRENYTYC